MLHPFWYLDEIEVNDDNEIEEDDPPSAELRFVPDDKSICKYTQYFFLVHISWSSMKNERTLLHKTRCL